LFYYRSANLVQASNRIRRLPRLTYKDVKDILR